MKYGLTSFSSMPLPSRASHTGIQYMLVLFIEAETRDLTRTDIVVDYLGNQYVIELKIWRGNSYNERGEQQLSEYLDYFHLETGYLVSLCFNRSKEPEMKTVNVGGRTIYEAVV